MKKVLLLLANGFEEYEASAFTDVFGWSRSDGDIPVQVTTCSLHRKLKCTWNFTVIPEIRLSAVDVSGYDALAIPGGFEEAGFYQDAYHPDFLELIRAFDRCGKLIAAVCVASLALGKSGILKNRRATTYHLLGGKRRKQLAEFGVMVVDRPLVEDGNIITCSCPAAALDTAFKLLEKLTDAANIRKVKTAMGFVY